jgi:alkylhydroperoxidase family enzyme
MEPRINVRSIDPAAQQAIQGLGQYVRQSGLDARLMQLIEIRASQINGCGF